MVQGASLAEVQRKTASQTPPPAEARGKSPAAPVLGVGAPTPTTCHRAAQWALRKARGQKGDH